MTKYRQFTAEFTANVVLEIIGGPKTVADSWWGYNLRADLASEMGSLVCVSSRWRLLERRTG